MAQYPSSFFQGTKNNEISVGYIQDEVIQPLGRVLEKLSRLASLRKDTSVTSALAYANGVKDVAMDQIRQEPVVKHVEELAPESTNSMKP